ncbi:hypothetical protein KAU11_09645 [Candidatus Babeliales bacterium]|nr:hypothetical protein [Candidatus Babeliales bacterium]
MATTSNSNKDWESLYAGFDTKDVGAGTIDPSIYATDSYREKKVKKIMIGGINLINYGGWDFDPSPLAMTIYYNPTYGAVLSYNLHYVPKKVRKMMIDFVIKSNIKRIKANKPIIIDYNTMSKAIPVSKHIVRLYKIQLIRVIETYPLNSWGTAIDQSSKLSNHYKKATNNDSTIKRFIKSIKGFF